MVSTRTVLFLCPHNAAKSVLAAAYFQQLAQERGLALEVTTAGTDPDARTSPAVVAALQSEGIDVSGHRPRLLHDEDLLAAWRIVSLGCELDDRLPGGAPVEHWLDVPPPSQDLAGAQEAIKRHLADFLMELGAEARQG